MRVRVRSGLCVCAYKCRQPQKTSEQGVNNGSFRRKQPCFTSKRFQMLRAVFFIILAFFRFLIFVIIC